MEVKVKVKEGLSEGVSELWRHQGGQAEGNLGEKALGEQRSWQSLGKRSSKCGWRLVNRAWGREMRIQSEPLSHMPQALT